MDRESKYVALADRLSSAIPEYWFSRDFLSVDQVRWPALVVNATWERGDTEDFDTAPTVWTLAAEARVHLVRKDRSVPFEVAIHEAIDAVDDALRARGGEATFGRSQNTTLGDVVQEAKIKGELHILRLPDDTRALVEIPIEMRVTF